MKLIPRENKLIVRRLENEVVVEDLKIPLQDVRSNVNVLVKIVSKGPGDSVEDLAVGDIVIVDTLDDNSRIGEIYIVDEYDIIAVCE